MNWSFSIGIVNIEFFKNFIFFHIIILKECSLHLQGSTSVNIMAQLEPMLLVAHGPDDITHTHTRCYGEKASAHAHAGTWPQATANMDLCNFNGGYK